MKKLIWKVHLIFQSRERRVCRLNKSLYGHKQASRNWFAKFSFSLKEAGYSQSLADYSLFTSSTASTFTAILIFVDYIIVIRNDRSTVTALKDFLHSKFRIKDLGPLKYFWELRLLIHQREFS